MLAASACSIKAPNPNYVLQIQQISFHWFTIVEKPAFFGNLFVQTEFLN